MKKLLAFVFVFATVVVATNVLSSCKDYDGDTYDDLQLQLARNDKSLRDLIGDNYAELCSLYNDVKAAQEQCSIQCEKKQAELDSLITALADRVGRIKSCDCDGSGNCNCDGSGDCNCDGSGNCNCDGSGNCNCDGSGDCDCDLSDLEDRITQTENDIAGLQTDYQTLSGLQDEIEGINERVGINETNISNFYTTLNDYVKTENINTIIQNFLQDYYTKQDILNTLSNYITNDYLTQNFYTKQDVVNLINSGVAETASNAEEALQRAINDSIWIEELKTVTWKADSTLKAKIDSLCEVLSNPDDRYVLQDVYNRYIAANDQKVTNLEHAVEPLPGLIEKADSARQAADDLLQKQINAIILALANLDPSIINYGDTTINYEGNTIINYGDTTINNIYNLDIDLSGLRDSVKTIWDIKLPDLEEAFKQADRLLQNQINALSTAIDDINDAIDDINDAIDEITGRLDDIDKKIADLDKKLEQITGIIPQATVNPVFGTIAAPLGISSKVLVTFYGEFTDAIEFPSNVPGNYVKFSQQFTDKDWEAIMNAATLFRAGTIAANGESGTANAGTLYVTVNPSEVNFAGATLKLVNSRDEESPMTLSALEKENDYLINFGYTRAATDNGLYRAQATISVDDIDAVKVDIEPGLKSAVTEAVKQHSMPSLANLGAKLYDQFNGILPAQALKAQWNTTLDDGSTYTRTFRSEYGLAAAAVKPLSYGVFDELNVVTVPGYEQVCSLIDRLAAEAEKQLKKQADKYIDKAKEKFNDLTPDMKKLAVAQIDYETGEVVYDVIFKRSFSDSEGNTFLFGNDPTSGILKLYDATTGEELYSLEGTGFVLESDGVHVAVTDKLLYNYLASSIMEVNQLVAAIQDVVDGVNDLIESLDSQSDRLIEKASDKVSGKIYTFIDKINNKLANLINTSGARIQPVLFVSTDAGTKVASGSKAKPTIVTTADVNLILTSHTGEILTPAYKKHIAAVDVIKGSESAQGGDSDCQAALNAFNQQGGYINTVFDGTTINVPATFQRGYTYVVAYSGLDYHGKISMHKYYIKF